MKNYLYVSDTNKNDDESINNALEDIEKALEVIRQFRVNHSKAQLNVSGKLPHSYEVSEPVSNSSRPAKSS